GAVQGRAAVQYHFHTRDGDVRYEGGDGRVDGAHAIHQGQGAVLAKAAQVEGGACGALRPVSSGVDVGDCIGVLGIGQVADVLTHVRRAGLVQVFLTDSINRGVLGELAVADIGAGDDKLLLLPARSGRRRTSAATAMWPGRYESGSEV